MTKINMLTRILNMGKKRERHLRLEKKNHEAFQIESARFQLLTALIKGGNKAVQQTAREQVSYEVDGRGYWQYNPDLFVFNKEVRALIQQFLDNLEVK